MQIKCLPPNQNKDGFTRRVITSLEGYPRAGIYQCFQPHQEFSVMHLFTLAQWPWLFRCTNSLFSTIPFPPTSCLRPCLRSNLLLTTQFPMEACLAGENILMWGGVYYNLTLVSICHWKAIKWPVSCFCVFIMRHLSPGGSQLCCTLESTGKI